MLEILSKQASTWGAEVEAKKNLDQNFGMSDTDSGVAVSIYDVVRNFKYLQIHISEFFLLTHHLTRGKSSSRSFF